MSQRYVLIAITDIACMHKTLLHSLIFLPVRLSWRMSGLSYQMTS